MIKYGGGKTGKGSFFTHKMVRPGGIEGLGKSDYRVERRMNELIPQAEGLRMYAQGKDRKEFLKNYTRYYGKKVAA